MHSAMCKTKNGVPSVKSVPVMAGGGAAVGTEPCREDSQAVPPQEKDRCQWERDGVQGLPEYTFFIVMFRCTVCGLGFEGGCSRKPAPYQLQYNIAAWNRICNGDKCFTLTYMSQEDGR